MIERLKNRATILALAAAGLTALGVGGVAVAQSGDGPGKPKSEVQQRGEHDAGERGEKDDANERGEKEDADEKGDESDANEKGEHGDANEKGEHGDADERGEHAR
jgi:hypothetical protein